MRTLIIENYIRQLKSSFGAVRTPVEEDELRTLYTAKNYAGMTRVIQQVLKLDLQLRLGLVRSAGEKAPAWIQCPDPMPMFGTAKFRQTRITMFLRKDFLEEVEFEQTVSAIAHELSHIVLHSIQHPLQHEEVAVDLTAMLLGFRDFFVTGCELVREIKDGYDIYKVGYMSAQEVRHAAKYMTYP